MTRPLLALLARVPDRVFRAVGCAFFLGVVAWRVAIFGSYWLPLWAVETAIFALIALAYVRRAPALERASSLAEVALPLVGGPLPFALNFAPLAPALDLRIAVALMLAGSSLSLAGYAYLGGSFSILVEARPVRTAGPYRFVRHPVYLGQLAATLGVLLARFSPRNAALYAAFACVQLARAALEERKLARVAPGYRDYQRRTGMLLPRVRGRARRESPPRAWRWPPG